MHAFKRTSLALILALVFFTLPFLVVTYRAVSDLDRRESFTELQIDGLRYHSTAFKLLIATYLADHDAAGKMQGEMDIINEELGEMFDIGLLWQHARNGGATQLIDALKTILHSVDDRSQLILDPFPDSYHLINILVNVLPERISEIQQATSHEALRSIVFDNHYHSGSIEHSLRNLVEANPTVGRSWFPAAENVLMETSRIVSPQVAAHLSLVESRNLLILQHARLYDTARHELYKILKQREDDLALATTNNLDIVLPVIQRHGCHYRPFIPQRDKANRCRSQLAPA